MIKNNSPLSLEFKIACEIYRCKKKGKLATSNEIANVFNLFGYDDEVIERAIDTLFDWSLLTCGYDKLTKLTSYMIEGSAIPTFKDLYKRYWKEERKELFLR